MSYFVPLPQQVYREVAISGGCLLATHRSPLL